MHVRRERKGGGSPRSNSCWSLSRGKSTSGDKSTLDGMFESPSNSYIEILAPIVMVLGGGVFWR